MGWKPHARAGEGRGNMACQRQKNRVSVLLIRMVAPRRDVAEASTAHLADGCG